MATRRSEIQVEVLGLDELRNLNTAMNVHDKRLQALTASYLAFNAAVSGASGGMKQFVTNNQTINNTLNQTDNTLRGATLNITKMGAAAGGADRMFGGMLGTLLRYRAVSLVFEGVQKSIGAVVQSMYDMEKQAARVQRVSAPGSTPGIRADIAVEAARTGADIKDIGEAYYQLKTQVKDNAAAFAALQTSMNLVVGTESDARDTTRAMLQIYNQFGDELGRNVDQAEKMRRAGELLAVMWKGSSAEVGEITQSLKYLGPIAELAKVSLTQVAGVITGLTAEGVRGRMGGTGTAQFLLQLVQHLNASTGMIENKGASAKAFIDANTGALDLLRTIQNIVEVGKRLPVEQQQKYFLAIGGSTQAARFLGAVNENAFKIITKAADEATRATHGLTHETDDLRQTMTTTAQEGQRAFGGLFSFLANAVDTSPLRGWLHEMGDYFQHLLEAMRMVQQLQSGQQAYYQQSFAPGANVRQAVTDTQSTVRESLARVRAFRNLPTAQQVGRGGELGVATEGMTQAQRDMIRHRYLPSGDTFRSLNTEAMANDLGTMMRQLSDPRFGQAAPGLGPANPFGPGLSTRPGGGLPGFGSPVGSYTDPKIEEARKELERKQEEARKAQLEKTKSQLSAAEADLEIKQKLYPTVDGRVDQRVSGQAQMVDLLKRSVAALTEDPLDRATELKKLKYGIGTAREKIDEEVAQQNKERAENLKRENEDKSKEHAAFLEYYAENARAKYGVFSPEAKQRAQQAQAAAEASTTGSAVDLMKLKDHAVGPMKANDDAVREAIDAIRERAKAAYDAAEAERDFGRGVREGFAQRDVTDYERRAQARQFGLRPNMLGGGADTRQEAGMVADIADLQSTIKAMARYATADQLQTMHDKLDAANAALTDFHDTLDQKAYSKRVQAEQDAFDLRNQEINHLHRLKFYKDEGAAEKDTVRKLSELVGSAEQNLADVKGINKGNISPESIEGRRKAEKELAEARQNLTDYQIDAKMQKYQNVYGSVKESVHGALSDFLHGKGDLGTVAERVGGSIVDAAIDAQIKRFADPLVQTVTAEILAIQGNTDALTVLNSTMGGGAVAGGSLTSLASSGLGAVVAAGVGAGIADAGGDGLTPGGAQGTATGAAGVGGGAYKQSDLQKGLGAGLAAYSIGATAAQQGVNAGNLLGGVATGASIGAAFGGAGALIGGAIGGVADLIGGLFHHKSTPTATPQDLNPAYYNAPSNFDVAAYNYSAYGRLPRMQDVGFTVNPANTPIVNVFVDGAKVAARQEIGKQTILSTVSLTNPNLNRHAPV